MVTFLIRSVMTFFKEKLTRPRDGYVPSVPSGLHQFLNMAASDVDSFDNLISSLPDHGDIVIEDLAVEDYQTCPEDAKESILRPIAQVFWDTCVDAGHARSQFWSRVNKRKPQSIMFRVCVRTQREYKVKEDPWYKCWTSKLDAKKRLKVGNKLDVVVPTAAPLQVQHAQPAYPQAAPDLVHPPQMRPPPQMPGAPPRGFIGDPVMLGHVGDQALMQETLKSIESRLIAGLVSTNARLFDIERRMTAMEEKVGVVLDVLEAQQSEARVKKVTGLTELTGQSGWF